MANNRSKKTKASLDLRRKAFDAAGHKPGNGFTRPGSTNPRKQA